MNSAIILLSLHAFMAWTGTTLPLTHHWQTSTASASDTVMWIQWQGNAN